MKNTYTSAACPDCHWQYSSVAEAFLIASSEEEQRTSRAKDLRNLVSSAPAPYDSKTRPLLLL